MPIFQPFGPSHLLVILFSFAIIFLVHQSRNWHIRHQNIISKIISWGIFSFFPLHQLYYFLVLKTFNISFDLPMLQICGVTLICAGIYLNAKTPKLQQFSYNIIFFWGIPAMLASFFTPALKEDFPHIYFWLFWVSHWLIVYILSYVFIIKSRQVRYINLWQSVLALAIYVAFIYPFNLLTGSNYAFLMQKPEIIHFGFLSGIDFDQSPAYLIPATIVIIILFHLVYAVQHILKRSKS